MGWRWEFQVNDRVMLSNEYGGPRGNNGERIHSWYSTRGLDLINPHPPKGSTGIVQKVMFDGVSPYYEVLFDGFDSPFTAAIHDLSPEVVSD